MGRKHVEINPECGRRLKQLLIENDVKQGAFAADQLHCHPQHISNIVNGRRSLTPEMAQDIAKVFPDIRVEWLLCEDDFKTEAEKRAFSKKVWEDSQKASVFYDKIFNCFIEGIEDTGGCGIDSQETHEYLGEEIVFVNDKSGKPIGSIPFEAFMQLQHDIENYASYSIHRLIQEEMNPLTPDWVKRIKNEERGERENG